MLLAVQIIGILTMLTFMFIGIWGFITLIQIHNQLKYKNYLMEKLIQSSPFNSSLKNNDMDISAKDEENINSDFSNADCAGNLDEISITEYNNDEASTEKEAHIIL